MLNNDSLAQLKQLKQQIEDLKEYTEGTIKGTQGRFGFVVLEDGREIYLSAEQMEKVFPGDRVRVCVTTDSKGKSKASAKLEKFLSSPLNEFTGRYIVKGKGHFVEPDLPRLSRWIFIPPSARKGAKQGDYIHCKISRHPYPAGKPQAKILSIIGSPEQPGIEAEFINAKFSLASDWPQDWQQSLAEPSDNAREDLTELPFVTIDASSTSDIDDALYAQVTEQGWQLQVAIADPSEFITVGSPLDKAAEQRAITTYLPGHTIAMLPDELANQRCSLLPGEKRPVLVCKIDVNQDGSIDDFQMSEATICSQAKLSYVDTAAYLDQQQDNIDCAETVTALSSVASALRQQRCEHHLVMDDQPDYHLVLNEQQKIADVEIQHKTTAHQLVEECMVAANRCAANMLGDSGVFISHAGFRQERLDNIRKLASEQLGIEECEPSTPEAYLQLMQAASKASCDMPVRAVMSRNLERSQLSNNSAPHFGMGLPAYTTFTSPIRKYSDLMVHRLIKAKLRGESVPTPASEQLDQLQERLLNSRQARRQAELWLYCQFLEDKKGQHFEGHVSQVNSNGFTVQLDDTGIEGFVESRQLTGKYSFDPLRLTLSGKTQTITLDQAMTIEVSEVDSARRHLRFTLPTSEPKPE